MRRSVVPACAIEATRAGSHKSEIEVELIKELFAASYRRRTMVFRALAEHEALHLARAPVVNPGELDAALVQDAAAVQCHPGSIAGVAV